MGRSDLQEKEDKHKRERETRIRNSPLFHLPKNWELGLGKTNHLFLYLYSLEEEEGLLSKNRKFEERREGINKEAGRGGLANKTQKKGQKTNPTTTPAAPPPPPGNVIT